MPIPGLSLEAQGIIRSAGFTVREYVEHFGAAKSRGVLEWSGDTCGCTDDRCRDGYHHDPHEECGCLRAALEDLSHHRAAADLWSRHHDGEDVRADASSWARHYRGAHMLRITRDGIDVARLTPNPGYVGTHDLPEGGYWATEWHAEKPMDAPPGQWWTLNTPAGRG